MMGNYGHGGLAGMPLMSHPMMGGMPSMGTGYGPWNMGGGAPAAGTGVASGGKTPVIHVYTKRRRMIEDGFYDGVGIQKCAVMEGVEICATFYFGQQVVALDYTVKSKMIQRIKGNELDHPDAVDEIEGEYAIADYDGDDYDILLDEHDEYEVSRIQSIFGMEVEGESLRDNATSNKVDYVNTVWWIWTEHSCNDHILSFINAVVCTMDDYDENGERDITIAVQYDDADEEMPDMIANVKSVVDWDEIYRIHTPERQMENVKMCIMDEEIKLCVEMAEDDLNSREIDALQILIEFV